MKIKARQSQARLFGRASESVTRGDRRERELGFVSPFPPLTARPNKRRENATDFSSDPSPLGGAPKERQNDGENLTPVGHPFITRSERRFAPTTVRQPRNGVRYGLEWVSAFIGIRNSLESGIPLLSIETAAVRLRWFAVSNVSYQVQYSINLQIWNNLTNVVGSGAETNIVDWTDGSRKLYRLVIQ